MSDKLVVYLIRPLPRQSLSLQQSCVAGSLLWTCCPLHGSQRAFAEEHTAPWRCSVSSSRCGWSYRHCWQQHRTGCSCQGRQRGQLAIQAPRCQVASAVAATSAPGVMVVGSCSLPPLFLHEHPQSSSKVEDLVLYSSLLGKRYVTTYWLFAMRLILSKQLQVSPTLWNILVGEWRGVCSSLKCYFHLMCMLMCVQYCHWDYHRLSHVGDSVQLVSIMALLTAKHFKLFFKNEKQTTIGKVLLETGKTGPGGKPFLLLSLYETLHRGQTSFLCKDLTWGYRMIFWNSHSMLVAEVE